MHDTVSTSVPANAEKLFVFLLLFYPYQYRKKYGHEMRLLFYDMYHEELRKKGKVGLRFWFFQAVDIAKGIIEQHMDMLKKQGMKKYLKTALNLTEYNLFGAILLLPIFIISCINFISRIVQRDLFGYNRSVYSFFSHTPLYWRPVLFTWVILFPAIAIVINIIGLFKNKHKKRTSLFSIVFLKRNIGSIMVLCASLVVLVMVRFHDFAPCVIHGLMQVGIGRFSHIISVCRNA